MIVHKIVKKQVIEVQKYLLSILAVLIYRDCPRERSLVIVLDQA